MGRPISCVLQHGLEVVGDHLIERRRLGAARSIAMRQRPRRGARAAFEHVLRRVRTWHDRRRCACNATFVLCGDSWRFATLRQDVRAPDARRPNTGRHAKPTVRGADRLRALWVPEILATPFRKLWPPDETLPQRDRKST